MENKPVRGFLVSVFLIALEVCSVWLDKSRIYFTLMSFRFVSIAHATTMCIVKCGLGLFNTTYWFLDFTLDLSQLLEKLTNLSTINMK